MVFDIFKVRIFLCCYLSEPGADSKLDEVKLMDNVKLIKLMFDFMV